MLKLVFINNMLVRIIKYTDKDGHPVATFDVVNEAKKTIILNTRKEFIGGLGIAEIFYKIKYITQWEIPILLKLCRGFVMGDTDVIHNLITNFYLKISEENVWHLKNKLGLKL